MPNKSSGCRTVDYGRCEMTRISLLIGLAYRSLMVHKLRSLLSVLGVVCGVMAVMSMISIGEGAKEKVLKEIEGLGLTNIYVNAVNLTSQQQQEAATRHSYGITWSDMERLQKHQKYVKRVAAMRVTPVQLFATSSAVTPKVVQTTPDYFQIADLTVRQGRPLLASDEQSNQLVCVLGADLAQQLGKDGRLGSHIRSGGSLFRVVGVLSAQSVREEGAGKIAPDNYNQTLILPFSAQERISPGSGAGAGDRLSRILVEATDGNLVAATSLLVERTLSLAHHQVGDYQVVVPQELLQQSLRTQRLFNTVLALIGGISLLVGGIGIMNIMLATVSERKHEIGLRRAVGATRRDIIQQFLAEAIVLTVIGGLLGIFLGLLFITATAGATGWPISITAVAMVVPFLLAVSTGIISGMYPAIQAARLDPILALRAI